MGNQEQAQKNFIISLIDGYRFTAIMLLNTLLVLIILNCLIFLFFFFADTFSGNVVSKKYSNVNLSPLYPHLSKAEIDNLLKETWSRPLIYEPFTQFKERPFKGVYVNVDNNGFRYTKNQGPWPPQPQSINVFLFGGSTTFGYGVPDDQTIASYLQEFLTEKLGRDVRVYNFGRGYYYLTQERILYEQLLAAGFVPDLAIFIDGLNDFSYLENKPLYTDRLRQLFAAGQVELAKKLISQTSLGQAAEPVREKIASLSQKTAGKQTNDPKSTAIDQIINRYFRDKKLIEAVSSAFGVKPIFVWQPIPMYNFDQSNYPFSTEGFGELNYSKYGYERLADLIREHPQGSNFIWGADIQRGLKEPLYIDQVHYSAGFSKIFAAVIADQLVARFNLKKESAPPSADRNR